MQKLTSALSALLVCAACASTDASSEHDWLRAYASRHAAELEAFELEQESFAQHNPLPQEFDYPGLGRILVRECSLVGWPGKALLRVEFTYVNTTERTVPTPRVTLAVTSADGEDWSESSLDLLIPFAAKLTANSTYSSWLYCRTEGIHTEAGWSWQLDLREASEPVAEDLPLAGN